MNGLMDECVNCAVFTFFFSKGGRGHICEPPAIAPLPLHFRKSVSLPRGVGVVSQWHQSAGKMIFIMILPCRER